MSGIEPSPRNVSLIQAGIIGVASIGLMWLTVAITLAMTVPEAQPGAVVALWPAAAIARNTEAQKLMLAAPDTPTRHRALALAGAALTREPVLATAASTLGAAAWINGDGRRAIAAYGYAEQLSRRDLASQMWFIERAVGRGDVADALAHYDVALRANPPFVGDTLLPVLARASAGAAVRRSLITLLAHRPSWRVPYLQTVLDAGLPPVAVAEQLAGARLDLGDPAQATLLAGGLNQLVQAKRYRLAAAMLPGARSGLRNGDFERVPTLLPFDWWLATDGDLTAYREPDGAGKGAYVLRVASRERGGVVARQLVALSAGRYLLGWVGGGETGNATPSIAIACAENKDRPLATTTPTAPTGVTRRFSLAFAVPDRDCEAQWIVITTPPAASAGGWIDALELKREPASSS